MKHCSTTALILLILSFTSFGVFAQNTRYNTSKFKQLDEELPTPNTYRTASGAPGHQYWQQQADYQIEVELDEENRKIIGVETITYHNNSPDVLYYLWLQLDQNLYEKDGFATQTNETKLDDAHSINQMKRIMGYDFDGGFKIKSVKNVDGSELRYTINNTMMRVDLPKPIRTGEKFSFQVAWNYNINDRNLMGGRGGYECFSDGNCLFTIAQWFPRMAVYSDANGWIHKQFLGSGEFTLPFGSYTVKITAPEDHLIASTGTLQNPEQVLSAQQRDLLKKSETATKPVIISTQKEAIEKELAYVDYKSGKSKKSLGKKTWIYQADSVRDFAFGSSRKFIWDAMGVNIEGRTVMAMSYYSKEGNPLWEKYSTEAVAHTLRVYSKYTIAYPYPKAISVEAANGMEYPMICFNYGRPEPDGTYSERIKYGMLGVVIHEVGHNFFPMIINSDERHWTWMDEGLNSFVQFLAEEEWEKTFPSRRGPAHKIVDYMKGDKNNDNPIMTDSESILQFGNNAYGKPATALNILRESVMGRELFDHAFKEYCRRWAFKHPTPADFFRTMEDASGTDLDWFWRGWFYTQDNVDISIEDVALYQLDTQDPDVEKLKAKNERDKKPLNITAQRNAQAFPQRVVDKNTELKDFYNTYDPLDVTITDRDKFKAYFNSLSEEEKKFLKSGKYFYEITFSNVGGLIMPIILEMEFEDGTKELKRIPAEIWRYHNDKITKVFTTSKPVKQFTLDPYLETADVETENNYFPRKVLPSKFQLYKQKEVVRGSGGGEENPMQRANKEKKVK
jgi:hypothetical protein